MKVSTKIGLVLISIAMLAFIFSSLRSCGPSKGSGHAGKGTGVTQRECTIKALKGSLRSGEEIEYSSKSLRNEAPIDSVILFDGQPVMTPSISTYDLPLGRHSIGVRYSYQDSSTCESAWSVEVISDIEPELMDYMMVDIQPHNPNAFTQGLTFYEGRLYEGTGQYGESFIHHYDPIKRDYSQRVDLQMNQFGEGITILGDKLYQLTYKSGRGIVYDLKSMEKLRDFNLPTAEGWGLTDDGLNLILSDGSNMLYYLDPVTFETIRELAVYNNRQKEVAINEMEYVDGIIYANLYGTSYIAMIDAATGKVTGYVDCRGIMPPELQTDDMDVLNGIAYNELKGTFYLTGKYWPKLFEVRFVPKPVAA